MRTPQGEQVIEVSLGFCAATIIQPQWLITTASCFDQKNRILHNTAYVHTDTGIKKIEYCKVVKHPDYKLINSFIPVNDLVLLKLRQPFDNLEPLVVNTRANEFNLKDLNFVYKLEDDRTDDVPLKILTFEECMKYFTGPDQSQIRPHRDDLQKTMFCTMRPETPPGYCANINASPLVHDDNVLVGLVSMKHDYGIQGRVCYRLYMFSRISSYATWIRETTDTNNVAC